jgi:hypothetical protein
MKATGGVVPNTTTSVLPNLQSVQFPTNPIVVPMTLAVTGLRVAAQNPERSYDPSESFRCRKCDSQKRKIRWCSGLLGPSASSAFAIYPTTHCVFNIGPGHLHVTCEQCEFVEPQWALDRALEKVASAGEASPG